MNKTKHEKKRKKGGTKCKRRARFRLVISFLAEALQSVVGEFHGVWSCIARVWLQLLLQALIVGFGEDGKLLVL